MVWVRLWRRFVAAHRGVEIVVAPKAVPPRHGTAERLVHRVLGGGVVAGIGEQLQRQVADVGNVELLEFVHMPSRQAYDEYTPDGPQSATGKERASVEEGVDR